VTSSLVISKIMAVTASQRLISERVRGKFIGVTFPVFGIRC